MGDRLLLQHLIITGALALALCAVSFLGPAGAEPAYALGEENYRPGQVIIKLRPGSTIEEINDRYGSTTLDDYFASKGIYLIKPPRSLTVVEFVEEHLEKDITRVLYAEPNFVAEVPEDPRGDARMKARGITSTSDSLRGSSDRRAARNLGLSCAAEISRGKGSTVAVLDTGAQLGHPALQAKVEGVERWDFVGKGDPNPSEVLDADGDGHRDRMAGHGTHVAGIVHRVAPAAKIMPLRVLNSKGYGDVYRIAKALSYARRHEANVINLSLGSSSHSKLLHEMIGNTINRGGVVVAAAGNANTSDPHYPAAGPDFPTGTWASADGLVAVTSVTSLNEEKQRKSDFANFGVWVDIAAPGEDIRSAFPVDKYADWSGTSMATPFISGQAALIHAFKESLEPEGLEARIRNNVDPLDEERLKYAGMLGTGHANVCKSLGG